MHDNLLLLNSTLYIPDGDTKRIDNLQQLTVRGSYNKHPPRRRETGITASCDDVITKQLPCRLLLGSVGVVQEDVVFGGPKFVERRLRIVEMEIAKDRVDDSTISVDVRFVRDDIEEFVATDVMQIVVDLRVHVLY